MSDLPESLRPDKETILDISRNIERIKDNRFSGPKTDDLRRWIYEVWESNPNVPYTKRELMERIRQRHPDCPEHPLSQQLYVLVQENRLRKCDVPGSGVSFVPVRSVDLFDLAEQGGTSVLFSKIPVSFGEVPRNQNGWLQVTGFVKMDDTGNVSEVRIVRP
ncbi:hypothetical protein Atc_1242 [Acidithiobacillus caldus SM-1]|uniref:Uncharacterized protein n=2 Tax=Acidithiobacillus caldus TaxID=33059 RepID=F9ZMY2_ACICS|nr:hypothetical protein Atc_1242 [Acidithiobacillus caldus SM-1]OFC49810.1 hypothetical protein BAE30_13090 [Acidithiobacillus caldus]